MAFRREEQIRVLVADDHPIVREGITRLLTDAGDMTVVGVASGGLEVVEKARQIPHDVILLDWSMPGLHGLELVRELARGRPRSALIVFTIHAEHQFALRALRAGAAGYLLKDTPSPEIVNAVRKVAGGGRYIGPMLAETLATHLSDHDGPPPHESLSDREYQVLHLIASGKSTRQIAEVLTLSVKTVATYRLRIFKKMNVNSSAELAAYVVRNGLED